MRAGLVAALLMTALAVAGCSGSKDDGKDFADVTCADGTIVTSEQIEATEGHHDAGFDPMSLCPVPPKVTLTGLPASVQVYKDAAFSWGIDPGSVLEGHSMITEIRYSTTSVPDGQASTTTYAKSIIKKEHQNLPVQFKGNMTFPTAGKVYVRAYAAVQGHNADGSTYERRDVWGPEVVLDVTPVAATGTVVTVTHAVGGPAGDLTADSAKAKLGDAVQFANSDVVPHTFSMDSGPNGAPACDLSADAQAASADSCMFIVPGPYHFTTDDVPEAKTITIEVTV